jgi:hypothetical protein
MACLPCPTHKTLKAFHRKFFNRTSENPVGYPMLGGSSDELYNDRDDLVALKVPEDPDRLTTFVQDHMGYMFEVSIFNHLQVILLGRAMIADKCLRQERETDI